MISNLNATNNAFSSNRNYHFKPTERGLISNAGNNYSLSTNLRNNINTGNNLTAASNNIKPTNGNFKKDNGSTFTNMNIFGFNNTNNRFFNNVNPGTMNQQERVINFGQDYNENSFKKILRKPTMSNLIQNTSYNIITGAPINGSSNSNFKYNFNKSYNQNYGKPEKVDDMFYSFKNNMIMNNGINSINNNNNFNTNNNFATNSSSSNITKNFENSLISSPTMKTSSPIKQSSPSATHSHNHNNYNTPYETDVYNTQTTSIKEYSYKEDQNVRSREYMEDKYKVIDKFNRENESGLFTLFDGHGGEAVAVYAKDKLPEIIEKLINNTKDKNSEPNYMENILSTAFLKIDEEMKNHIECENVGCTASVIYITKEKESTGLRRVLYSANVGDSRSVLISNMGAKRLSYDHKASDKAEANRILSSGGILFAGRVFGLLILSRALGDHGLKKHGVIANPFINKHYISDKDRYLILASDGVWDVITDDDVYRLHLTVSNSDEFAKLIIKTALLRGSMDNISCIVLKLN